ncbi:MAG: cellulase family glycosylhydrolase [Bacteroidales bacterium]|nr:cellulase family glycosylhydrolase [Bacteroidales bacterium]
MKKITILLFSLLFVALSCKRGSKTPTTDNQTFVIKRGVNISHWLSQTTIRGEERAAYMTEKDFKTIAGIGFDHLRIPIDEEQMWDTAGNKQTDAFQLLHNAIDWSFQNNLRVIVDLHILRSHHFNEGDQPLWTDSLAQKQFWGFWEQLSDELIEYPVSKLAYELMNEAVAENPDDWNNLLANGIKTIRAKEPLRKIVVGSNMWQVAYTFPELKIPENDTNLILSFHFYEPFLLTHHQAPWTSIKDYTGTVHYPGFTIDANDLAGLSQKFAEQLGATNLNYTKETMGKIIGIPVKYAKEHNLPLYCGEFGCFPTTPISVRQQYYSDLIDIFNENNIAWAHWNYKNDFPLVDETLVPIKELTDILMK